MLYQQPWYLYFLVVAVVVYWTICRTGTVKKLFLVAASIGLLASLQPAFTAALLGWTATVFFASRYLLKETAARRLRLLVVAILALLGYLSFFKYLPGLLRVVFSGSANADAATWLQSNVVIPIGLSYFTFKYLHYLVNAYRGTLAEHSPLDFVLYTVFFPIVPAGPIERIENFVGKARLSWDVGNLTYGIQRIVFGAAKKLLLVDTLLVMVVTGPTYDDLMGLRFAEIGVLDVWIFLSCSFLYAYLDFSAYTDLAVGTGRLFGYRICENFNLPVLKPNLSEFWKSWHMSLSAWCRDYIYIPVLAKTRRPKLALYASMMTIGAWHYINFNWLVWGALHATGLVVLMYWQRYRKQRLPWLKSGSWPLTALGTVLTFTYVSWVFAFVCLPSPVVATQTFLYAVSGLGPP